MRLFGKFFILVVLATAAAGMVASQPPGGGQPPAGGKGKGKGKGVQVTDYMTLLSNAGVKAELKVTDEQLNRLPAALYRHLAEVLSEPQRQRLRAIYLQQRGISAVLDSDIKQDLSLTSDQAQKIQSALDRLTQTEAEMKEAGGFNNAKLQELQKTTMAMIQGALTADQKLAWVKMVGQPFQLVAQGKGKGGGGQKKGKQKAQATDAQLRADFKGPLAFDVTIFAKPPDANYPTCLYPLPNGEVFIGSDQQGSLGKTPKMGRVIRAVDTKGTGKADSFSIFCEVDHPRGIIYDDGTMWICHPPDLSVYYEDKATGKAARSEVLIKGVSSEKAILARGADHTTNNIRMAIDGWIYIAVGDFGMLNGQSKEGTKITMRGGIARIRPDGTGFEQVTWGSRNIYDIAIDPYMNLFCRDNTNDGRGWDTRFHHMIPSATNGYPTLFVNFEDETNHPIYDFGGGGPTGALFTDEPLLPKPYDQALFLVEWGKKVINRAFIEPQGASFKIGQPKHQEDFVRCNQPTVIDTDGAGRLYVGSWLGGQFTYVGPYVGYVAQMTPKNFKPVPFPDVKKATDADLLRYVTSPGGTLRLHAQREMLRRGDKELFAKGLEKFAASDGGLLAGRVAAIFTLELLRGAKSHPALVQLANNATVREFALKALADDKKFTAGVPVDLFVRSLQDPNPRVRLQAVIGLGRLGQKGVADKLVPLLADSDPSVAHVAYRNLSILGATEACLKALAPSSSDKVILGSIFALQERHEPAVVDGLIRKLKETTDPRVKRAVIRGLSRLYYDEKPRDGSWWGTQPNTKGPYYQTIKWSESDKIAGVLGQAVTGADTPTLAALLQEVNKCNVPFKGKSELTVKLAATEAKFRPQAVDILATQADLTPEAIALLQKVAVGGNGTAATVQAKALRGLIASSFKRKDPAVVAGVLASLGAGNLPRELKTARNAFINDGRTADHVAYFGKLTQGTDQASNALAYAVLLQVSGNRQLSPAARNLAGKYLEAAWAKPAASASLLRAIGDVQAEEFALQIKQYLKDPRANVKAAAEYAAKRIDLDALSKAKTGPTVGTMKYDDVFATALKTKGDPDRGSRLFLKQGCVLCHTISALDMPKGPPLYEAGTRYKKDELLESILKPSAKIAQGFETRFFLLNNGKMLEGFVTREAGDEIEIRDLAGVPTVIHRSDIDQTGRRETSMMPNGLVDGLSVQDLAALVAYLESLKKN